MTYSLHKQAKNAHNDLYMYKNETNRVRYQPLTTPRVVLIFIIALHLCDLNNLHENQYPLRTAEPCEELTKPKKNNKYFWCFRFFRNKQTKKNQTKTKQTKQSKIFLDFSFKANQSKETKKQTKRNNENIFGIFVFLERSNKNQKESETMD